MINKLIGHGDPIYLTEDITEEINIEVNQNQEIKIIDYAKHSDLKLNINIVSGSLKLMYFALGKKNDFKKIVINAVNKMPETSIDIIAKAVQFDNSIVSIQCSGTINENCKNAKSAQELRALTFNQETKTELHPILNIYHNQVEAGHAATVGKVDDKLVYYLMSRGISKLDSTNFLINSFISTTFEDPEITKSIFNKVKELYEEK